MSRQIADNKEKREERQSFEDRLIDRLDKLATLLEALVDYTTPLFEAGDRVHIETNAGTRAIGRVYDSNVTTVIVDENPDDPDNPQIKGIPYAAMDFWNVEGSDTDDDPESAEEPEPEDNPKPEAA
jgi:hypothetical protein